MAITNIDGVPFIWDEQEDKNLLGSLFPNAPNTNTQQINNNKNFKSTSRDIWKSMRQGTPYQQPEPDTEPYTANFYGLKKEEGVDLPSLIEFVFKATVDHTLVFNESLYEKPATYQFHRQRDGEGGFIDKMEMITNTIPFIYVNEKGINKSCVFSVKLNKRIDYLEDSYVFTLRIENNNIRAHLYYYYENTKQYRIQATDTTNPADFRIDDKYLAISFTMEDLNDFRFLIKTIEGKDSFDFITKTIIKRYADALLNSKSGKELKFLYERIPDFVAKELSKFIKPELMFDHIKR